MAELSMRDAKRLCTAEELRSLQMSVGAALERSGADLQQSLRLLRRMRDKWRTQATAQRRRLRSERGGDANSAASRSAAKEQLFLQAIDRIERRMAQRSTASLGSLKRSRNASELKRRSESHRRTRADVRGALRQELVDSAATAGGRGATPLRGSSGSTARSGSRRTMTAAPSKSSKPSKPSRPSTTSKSSKSSMASKPLKPLKGPAGRKAGKPLGRTTGVLASVPLLGTSPAPTGPIGRARSASGLARAKTRLAASLAPKQDRKRIRGLSANLRGHVSAQGRRRQARRDAQQARSR